MYWVLLFCSVYFYTGHGYKFTPSPLPWTPHPTPPYTPPPTKACSDLVPSLNPTKRFVFIDFNRKTFYPDAKAHCKFIGDCVGSRTNYTTNYPACITDTNSEVSQVINAEMYDECYYNLLAFGGRDDEECWIGIVLGTDLQSGDATYKWEDDTPIAHAFWNAGGNPCASGASCEGSCVAMETIDGANDQASWVTAPCEGSDVSFTIKSVICMNPLYGLPTISPTDSTVAPTSFTTNPSSSPTRNPSTSPTRNPSVSPTKNPLYGDVVLYENPGPITPAVNSADLTAIPIRDCMRYKLDVVINAWCTHGSNWCAIMHVGNDDDISKQALQRMPSLSLLRDKLYIGASITTENKYGHWPPTGGLSLGTVYSYDIVYKNTDSSGSLTVTINDEVVYDDVNWGHHCVSGETCQGVPVAEATPIQLGQQDYYGALDGTVSNIKIYDCEPPPAAQRDAFYDFYPDNGNVYVAVSYTWLFSLIAVSLIVLVVVNIWCMVKRNRNNKYQKVVQFSDSEFDSEAS
eukprot:460788_1